MGLNHEQQHQELILTDIKHVLSCNPILPAYDARPFAQTDSVDAAGSNMPAEPLSLGMRTTDFCFDNELPRHRSYLQDFSLANRPVTCGEFIEFIEDGGYTTPTTLAVARLDDRL